MFRLISFALPAAAALFAGAALAQEADWRPVTEIDGVEIWYDADQTLARDGLTRVIVRSERVQAETAPGAGGRYVTLAETLMLDCAAREYTSAERAYYDAAGAEVLSVATPEGPKPYADGVGVDLIAGMVC